MPDMSWDKARRVREVVRQSLATVLALRAAARRKQLAAAH